MRRVVVTGMGAITPLGLNVKEYFDNIKAGNHGFGIISKFDAAEYKAHVAAEVKGFVAKEFMDFKAAKRMEPFSQYAVAAAKEAMEQSGLDMSKEDPLSWGCSIGSGIGSLQVVEKSTPSWWKKGPNRVNPLMVPMMISNMAAGNVSIDYGLKGKSLNVVTACATGTHSIGEAYRSIQVGDADVMLAGGTESCICPIGVAGFAALTALSGSEDPSVVPFRSIKIATDLSWEKVQEWLFWKHEHAQARGAKILAEVVGYGATSDAYHITSPAEDGMECGQCHEVGSSESGAAMEDIMYINAHGTSTHHNDLFETRAIKLAFGEHAKNIKINSTKSMVGHLLGAAGAVEFITCVKEMEEELCSCD